jgi:hypothetical protein
MDAVSRGRASRMLKRARDKGITARLDQGLLKFHGPQDKQVLAHARAIREDLKEVLRNPSPAISPLIERLRRGQKLLVKMQSRLWGDDGLPRGSEGAISSFLEAIIVWDTLEGWLQDYGEYSGGCPIGPNGCDHESPVICRACVR